MTTEVAKQSATGIQSTGNQINPMSLIQTAMSENLDLDKLERLMDMEERHNARHAKMAFNQALAQFQAKCPVIKSLKQGHNYQYAPISDIVAQIKDLLSECGLSYRFSQSEDGNNISVTCVITHNLGHSEETTMTGEADNSGKKNIIQAKGSAVTYLRRYTLTGALGIVTGDADTDGRVDAARGITNIDKEWVRLIRRGEQSLDNIDDLNYRQHIADLLEQAK